MKHIDKDYRTIIFPASRSFTAVEQTEIDEQLSSFISQWKAHGVLLSAQHQRFFFRQAALP